MVLAPFPWPHKAPCPYPAPKRLRLALFRSVDAEAAVGQGPTLPHGPCIDVGPIRQQAHRKGAPVAVATARLTPELALAHVASQLLRGGPPASPPLSPRIGAGLVQLGRVDSLQA